jgi:glutathione S-transferase
MARMITLYHAPRSRSSRFVWLLEELETPYELVQVTIRRRDGSGGPDPKNPNPDKKVPALVHAGALVTESAAIALYLTDLFPARHLGPQLGERERGAYLTWLAYYAGVMEPAIQLRASGQTSPELDAMDRRIVRALEAAPHLLGASFSAADILIASVALFSRAMLPAAKVVDDYLARVTSRTAFKRALAKEG